MEWALVQTYAYAYVGRILHFVNIHLIGDVPLAFLEASSGVNDTAQEGMWRRLRCPFPACPKT